MGDPKEINKIQTSLPQLLKNLWVLIRIWEHNLKNINT